MAIKEEFFGQWEGIDTKLIEIEEGLFQGSQNCGDDEKILKDHNITQVLAFTDVGIKYIKGICKWMLCMPDGEPLSQDQILFLKIFAEFNKNKRVLIHCRHGNSRSSAGIIIWAMVNKGMTKKEAADWLSKNNRFANCRQEIYDSIPEKF